MSNEVIKVINLTKRFGRKTILKNVNMDIYLGEIFGIIGMSGSGKTTLLNSIIGFLQPEIGDIQFKIEHLLNFKNNNNQFRSVFTNENVVKMLFGFASQDPSIYLKLTCMENLNYFGRLYNIPSSIRKTNIEIILKLMNLYESKDIPAAYLSGGMKKRLDIACALIHDPKILILDEPTADLDPLLRKQMWNLINEINAKGTTIILTSHFLDELERYCNRVCILNESEIIITGTPHEVKQSYSKEQEIRVETSSHEYIKLINVLNKRKENLKITRNHVEGSKLVISTTKAEMTLRVILSSIKTLNDKLIDVTVEDPSLEYVLEKIRAKDE